MKNLLTILFVSFGIFAISQYNNPGGTITDCAGTFNDTGGAGGQYGPNENITTTFCATAGQCIEVAFTSFNIDNGWHFLNVYDGPTTASTQLGSYTGTTSPGTITSTTGCLTFEFISDPFIFPGSTGWTSNIACVPCPAVPDYTHPIVGSGDEKVGACLITDCGPITYTDNGGFNGNYANDIPGVYNPNNAPYRVFCPDAAGQCMRVTFNEFETANANDVLWVRNGPTEFSPNFTSAPTQPTIFGGGGPFDDGLFGDLNASTPFSFTSTHASGCLTFAFISSNVNQDPGWSAVVECTPCAGGPSGTDNNDCNNVTAICGTATIPGNSTGPGIVAEGCVFGSCPAGGENHTNWYTFTASSTGILDIQVAPTSATDDYDFAVYGPNVTCNALGTPIRCSDAGITGATGIGGDTDFTEDVNGNGLVQSLSVTAGETYILVVDEWTPTGAGYDLIFGGSALLDCSVLPVELSEFNVGYVPEENVVDLNWITESERNNDRFEVERSTDGVNFEVINIVRGAGTTENENHYYTLDQNPSLGVNYYRLNQFDIDGNGKYTEVRAVNILDDMYDLISAFPNPSTGITEVIFNSYKKENVKLNVISSDGRTIVDSKLEASPGGNRFKLDLSDYQKGLYFITITTAEKTYTTKLTKK
ncbi:MAG: T9SS type A sorting domain-containing protein [Crocinitomicaceae bacterium]|nr:T9SS type A sorting domain-containing protein [Crocinitomicaceae bacterium]